MECRGIGAEKAPSEANVLRDHAVSGALARLIPDDIVNSVGQLGGKRSNSPSSLRWDCFSPRYFHVDTS